MTKKNKTKNINNNLKVTNEEKNEEENKKLTIEQKKERRKFMIKGSIFVGSFGMIVFIISVILYSVL